MRVLIADDDRMQRHRLKTVLSQWDYDVILAEDGLSAWEKLSGDDAPAMAVLDWMMPGMEGVELCRRIRDRQGFGYTYILILSARHEIDHMVAAIDSGADDFIAKPFHNQELRVRMRSGRRLVEMHQELHHRATRDALTSVFNRAQVIDILKLELSRVCREAISTSVMMLDVDYFKQINDTYGHTAGDEVLCEVCRRLENGLRQLDALGRIGGEEFLVVLPCCDLKAASIVAERLRHSIAAQPIMTSVGPINVTASFGITSTTPNATHPDQLLIMADQALYAAKGNGRNRVEMAQRIIPFAEQSHGTAGTMPTNGRTNSATVEETLAP